MLGHVLTWQDMAQLCHVLTWQDMAQLRQTNAELQLASQELKRENAILSKRCTWYENVRDVASVSAYRLCKETHGLPSWLVVQGQAVQPTCYKN